MTVSSSKTICVYLMVMSIMLVVGLGPQNAWAQPVLNLPTGPVTLVVYDGAPISYFSTVLSNVPAGYDVTNGTYPGWCIEEPIFITEGVEHTVTLYSSYDPSLPAHLQDPDWDMVNYLLNHKQGDSYDIQNATWYFVNGGNMPTSLAGQAMVNDALANGEGFIPVGSQVIAVICDTGIDEHDQRSIIEVEPPRLVGGEILAVNTLESLAPFLILSAVLVAGTIGVLFTHPRRW
jgi:hypothetical protein